jgi:SAM-dependent methyltransferase
MLNERVNVFNARVTRNKWRTCMSDRSSHDELRAAWLAAYNRPFVGWDFSSFAGRRVTIRPVETWDYVDAIRAAIQISRSMLDMDTGGGEFLASLPVRPPRTYATEGYAPNAPVARQRLEPLGVEVHEVTDVARLPFADGAFDLVTNRHGAYAPHELRRVLVPNGCFITQQVGSQTNRMLHDLLGDTTPAGTWDLATAVRGLETAGFQILEQREEFPVTRYFDVGAIVYYLKAIPWEIPDFSVEKYFDKLVAIHHRIQTEGYVDIRFHQFFVMARRV